MAAYPSLWETLAPNYGLEGEGAPVFGAAHGWSRASIT